MKVSKRNLAQWLHGSGALEALLRARARTWSPWVTVLTYHRIHPTPDSQPFDPDVIDATPEQFEEQVLTLRRYFTLVGVDDVLRFMKGASLPPNPAVITFDDGYRECHDNALPILQKHGVKAAFFIATRFITERRVFWWDRISYILRRCKYPLVRLEYPRPMLLDLTSGFEAAQREVLAVAKGQYDLDVERFLEELSVAAGVPWDSGLERKYADELVMTWDQVRALRDAGMEVHSHTRTHRILQNLPAAELWRELSGSRRDLEEQLGIRTEALSYPVGRPIASSPAIRAAVHEAGYRVGFSNGSGSSWLRSSLDPLDIRRISLEVDLPSSYFRALLAIPMFGSSP